MDKGTSISFIEERVVQRDDPIKYFLLKVVKSTFWVPERVMTIEIPWNEEVSVGRINEEGGVSLAIRLRRATRTSVNVKKTERERVI